MGEINDAFGSLSVGTVLVFLAGMAALWKLYKKVESGIIEKYKKEGEEDKKLQTVMTQVEELPKLANAIEEIKTVQKENASMLENVARHLYESDATTARYRILRFNDEVLHGQHHTKEHFDQILGDITSYETYCSNHPEYENNKAVMAICNIKRVYQQCAADNEFL